MNSNCFVSWPFSRIKCNKHNTWKQPWTEFYLPSFYSYKNVLSSQCKQFIYSLFWSHFHIHKWVTLIKCSVIHMCIMHVYRWAYALQYAFYFWPKIFVSFIFLPYKCEFPICFCFLNCFASAYFNVNQQ